MTKGPTISVVIVSRNTAALLRDCLASIFNASPDTPPTETIVVDNGSSDGSAAMVKKDFPSVRLIENRDNPGFSKATNQGIRASTGPYVLLLNSDTLLERETLAYLADFMDRRPEAGACGARLVMADGRVQPYLFGSDPTLSYLVRRALKRAFFAAPLHDWETRDLMEVDWASGACLMTRREALNKAGLLDEEMFMYFEDTDLCLRIRGAGWKVYYNPGVTVTHLGGQSALRDKERRSAYFVSLRYFYRKHYGHGARAALWLLLLPYRFYLGVF